MAPVTTRNSPALTREELVQVLTMPLAAKNSFLSSGVRIFDAPQAVPLKIPKLSEFSESDWYTETEEIADSEAPTEYLTLLPSTLKSVKTWLPLSSQVIRNSPLALEANMRDQLVFSVSRTLEQAFFKGDNTPDVDGYHTPEGVLNWSGTQTTDMAGEPVTLDDLADMVSAAESEFAEPSVFWMTPRMWNSVRKIKDTLERYQLNPSPGTETGKSLFGIPVITTPYVADETAGQSSVILADTSQIAVGRDNAPEARIFTETLAKSDQIALRVTCRYDAGPLWAKGIVILNNVAETAPAEP